MAKVEGMFCVFGPVQHKSYESGDGVIGANEAESREAWKGKLFVMGLIDCTSSVVQSGYDLEVLSPKAVCHLELMRKW